MGRVSSFRRSPAVLITAILLLAVNLRLSVNSLGAVLPEIRHELHLSDTLAGVLLALPPLVFAFAGIGTPAIAARIGSSRLVASALVLATTGQLLRIWVDGIGALFAGTFLTLIGIAIGNVLMPGLIRLHFPHHITTLTALYVTMLSAGATVGSGASIPLQHALHGTWRTGFLLWAAVTALAVLPWLVVAARAKSTGAGQHQVISLSSLFRSRLAWAMALFFGMQSAHAYVAIGWLGQVLLDSGVREVEMGALLAMGPAIGIVLALTVPNLMRRQQRIPGLLLLFGISFLIGYVGLLMEPTAAVWLWMFCIGLGSGTFPTVLTLLALRANTGNGVIALSAFTQCVGYLLAALGPLLFGLAHDVTGSWTPSILGMVALLVPMVAIGFRLARERFLEDELRSRSAAGAT